ncbi:MAG: 7-carboxy-7-deazaguanine synthase QueE [Calditrichaeota bacterium]|nr:MAG: 7-carboxy-7-deazaguanine synthase QueE [Calditrichota bacterium]
MRITEIFYSIQGESSYAGLPCVFVRTTGCNLRCVWCDTDYAFYGGKNLSIEEIIQKVESYGCKLVELTGGEPLLQKEIYELSERLLEKGYTVLIETSGERDISKLDPRIIKIMDIKCPGSGESHRNRWENLEFLTPKDEVKFVIKDRQDYEWAVTIINKYKLDERVQVLFSPVWGEMELKSLAEWILQDRLKVRFQVQLHKFIWSPETRGV